MTLTAGLPPSTYHAFSGGVHKAIKSREEESEALFCRSKEEVQLSLREISAKHLRPIPMAVWGNALRIGADGFPSTSAEVWRCVTPGFGSPYREIMSVESFNKGAINPMDRACVAQLPQTFELVAANPSACSTFSSARYKHPLLTGFTISRVHQRFFGIEKHICSMDQRYSFELRFTSDGPANSD